MISSIRNLFLPTLSYLYPPAYFARPGEIALTTLALNSLGGALPRDASIDERRTAAMHERTSTQRLLKSTERLICQIDPELIGKDRANGSSNPIYRRICDIYFFWRKTLVNPRFRDQLLEFRQACLTSQQRLNNQIITTRRLPPPAPVATAASLTPRPTPSLPPQTYRSTARTLSSERVSVSPLTPVFTEDSSSPRAEAAPLQMIMGMRPIT